MNEIVTEVLRLDLLGTLLLASLLGGVIGAERELSGKVAGLRTNLLICVGAALITDISAVMAVGGGDPGRIAAQIVSGIGFLGAGTIIQSRGSVIGLTTAATLWVVAGIGMAVGARAHIEAVGTTILVLVALRVLRRVETRFMQGRIVSRRLALVLDQRPELVETAREAILVAGLEIEGSDAERTEDALRVAFTVSGRARHWVHAREKLLRLAGVRRVTES